MILCNCLDKLSIIHKSGLGHILDMYNDQHALIQSVCLQVRGKFNAVLDDNRKLKEDQSVLLVSLKVREERVKELEDRVKELEEKNVKVQERTEESKETLVTPQQGKCSETLDKPIQTLSIDSNVSNHALATYTVYIH